MRETTGNTAVEAEIFPIYIDKEGTWYYKGAEMFRKDILALFFEALRRDANGKYYLEMEGKRYYIQVEDTPFVVKAVNVHSVGEGGRKVELVLNDGSLELLDGATLKLGRDNVLYCSIKGGRFDARFSRPAWYQLAGHVEFDEEKGWYTLAIGSKRYTLKGDVNNGG